MDIQRLRASGALSGPYARARHRAPNILIWIVPTACGLAAGVLFALWT